MSVEARSSERANSLTIDATGYHYKDLNEEVHRAAARGVKTIQLDNVNGQRYICGGLNANVSVRINGTPGNDLGVFMDGPNIDVFGNAQDCTGNTMNSGRIVVHGNAGQIVGLSMRGGSIFIRGSVGYRSGIHMKGYRDKVPVLVIGGQAGAFLGEYMAGGRIYVLGLTMPESCPLPSNEQAMGVRVPSRCRSLVGMYTGTGMHGGAIYVRGEVDPFLVGKEVAILPPDEEDLAIMKADLREYANCFGLNADYIMSVPFTKLIPRSHRPYGKFYAY